MYINKLKSLMKSPSEIDINSITANIELVEKYYKFKFPGDYIRFLTNYGAGQIDDFISIYCVINSS